MKKINNDLIFIIGGLGLIGKEVVKAFKKKKIKTVVFDIKENSLKKLNYVQLSNFDLESIELNLNHAFKKYGTPNILINTSYPKTKDWNKNSFKSVKINSYLKNIDLHLNSFIWITKIVADQMIRKKVRNASIINLSSIYGFLGQDPRLYKEIKNMSESITYPVIKGGIINSCRSMSAYYGQFNIRINCISPGGIFDSQNKEFVKRYNAKTPLGRMGKVKEIVEPIIFLASSSSSYITGHNLVVDGGFSII